MPLGCQGCIRALHKNQTAPRLRIRSLGRQHSTAFIHAPDWKISVKSAGRIVVLWGLCKSSPVCFDSSQGGLITFIIQRASSVYEGRRTGHGVVAEVLETGGYEQKIPEEAEESASLAIKF